MRCRAFVRNEGVFEMTWFIYIEWEDGATVYSARFDSQRLAQRVANAMNRAWNEEGRLYVPDPLYL